MRRASESVDKSLGRTVLVLVVELVQRDGIYATKNSKGTRLQDESDARLGREAMR